MARAKSPSGEAPPAPSRAGNANAVAPAPEPTLIEHYLGKAFADSIKAGFATVEPALVTMLILFCLSLLYP